MPESASSRQSKYRENKIKKLGIDEYRRQNAEKAKQRRSKLVKPPDDVQLMSDLLLAFKTISIDESKPPELKDILKNKLIKTSIVKIKNKNNLVSIEQAFIDHSNKTDRPVKPSTIKQYFAKINVLHKKMFKTPWDYKNFDFLKDTDKIISFIPTAWSNTTTQFNYFNAITSIVSRMKGFESEHKIYAEASKVGLDHYVTKRKDNVMSIKQKNNILSWPQILKLPRPKQNILLFELLRWIPRRPKAYRLLRWSSKTMAGENYFRITGKNVDEMVLNQYKTDQKYGLYRTKMISGVVKKVLLKHIKDNNISDGDLLFPNKFGKVQTQPNFSHRISDVYFSVSGKKMGATLLRISFASYISSKNFSVNKLEKLALALGHSPNQFKLYSKIDLK